jgi:carboxyl-terminal processing protease
VRLFSLLIVSSVHSDNLNTTRDEKMKNLSRTEFIKVLIDYINRARFRGKMKIRISQLNLVFLLLCSVYAGFYYFTPDSRWSLKVKIPNVNAKDQAEVSNKETYDLQQLVILNRVVMYVEDNYVEPKRINRAKMVASALTEVQEVVPEITTNIKKDDKEQPISVSIQLNTHKEVYMLNEIKNRYHLIFAFRDMFGFIQRHLEHFDELRDIEYAAINGMLSTLDPHSTLLTPEAFAEMRLNTRGRFGGLGISIGIRENQLTILNPIENTPASKAGLQANDKIVQINLDSTVNMSLSDAVNMMRGEPGTDVDIYIVREGWKSPRKFTLTRDSIKVKSVKSLDLGQGIALIRVQRFQNTTVDELKLALKQFKRSQKRNKINGLVLDLRYNPGGLLEQATRMVDLFIDEGMIVKTVAFGDKIREPQMATKEGTLKRLPIIVLVNASSASASEIVAGALRNHERALIIGQRTFGKGSVQQLMDNPDESALKLTIAQYLTPGDISIQSVGIAPHIKLSPVLLTDKTTYFFGNPNEKYGEASLPEHLENERSKLSKVQKPLGELRYVQDPDLLEQQRKNPNRILKDFEMQIAKDILIDAKSFRFRPLLASAHKIIKSTGVKQEQKIDKLLRAKDIQWLSQVNQKAAQGEATITLKEIDDKVLAGSTLEIQVTVRNTGRSDLHKVRGMSQSENPYLKDHEFILGHIPVGESRTWTEKVEIPSGMAERLDTMSIKFEGDGKSEISEARTQIHIQSLPKPHFNLSYRIDDQTYGNGDGLLSPGEEVEMILNFINQGTGATQELVAHLSNEGKGVEPGLFIKRGRITPENQIIKPQGKGHVRFRFKVKQQWKKPSLSIYLSLLDPKLRQSSSNKIELPIHIAPQFKAMNISLESIKKSAKSKRYAPDTKSNTQGIYNLPSTRSQLINYIQQALSDGCLLDAKNQECAWYRIPYIDQKTTRYYWANALAFTAIDSKAKAEIQNKIEDLHVWSDAKIKVSPVPLKTEDEFVNIDLSVKSPLRLKDIMIYVNRRKVFFLPRADMNNTFHVLSKAKLTLEPGVNQVNIYARHSKNLVSKKTLFIYKPKTQKTDVKIDKK